MVNFKEINHFPIFQGSRGVQHFHGGGGGGPTFSRGGDSLFPIETHISCDFPGGIRTPRPPLWIRTCVIQLKLDETP